MKTTTIAMIALIGLMIFAGAVEAKSALKRMRADAVLNKGSAASAKPQMHGAEVSAAAKKPAAISGSKPSAAKPETHGSMVSSVAKKQSMNRQDYRASQAKKSVGSSK